MINSQAVTLESWLVRCSPRAPGFSREQSASPQSSIERPEYRNQRPASIVERPESSVQHLRPESKNPGMPNKIFSFPQVGSHEV